MEQGRVRTDGWRQTDGCLAGWTGGCTHAWMHMRHTGGRRIVSSDTHTLAGDSEAMALGDSEAMARASRCARGVHTEWMHARMDAYVAMQRPCPP